MYNIIPLLLILISLSIIIIIIVRKFSALASLDIENIPAEKEARFKEQIISSRLKRNITKWSTKLGKLIKPIIQLISNFFKWLHAKLSTLKDDYKSKEVLLDSDSKQKIDKLFNEAEECKKQSDLVMAEKRYIEIIGLDSKNIKAFKLLAQLYFERKDYGEAKETYEHILKLKADDEEVYEGLAQIDRQKGNLIQARDKYLKSLDINSQRSQTYFDLALVYQTMGNIKEAVLNAKKALQIEPNNPRYLDTLLEISIMNKDKALASEAYKKLAEVNPDNQKLADLREQIDAL